VSSEEDVHSMIEIELLSYPLFFFGWYLPCWGIVGELSKSK